MHSGVRESRTCRIQSGPSMHEASRHWRIRHTLYTRVLVRELVVIAALYLWRNNRFPIEIIKAQATTVGHATAVGVFTGTAIEQAGQERHEQPSAEAPQQATR